TDTRQATAGVVEAADLNVDDTFGAQVSPALVVEQTCDASRQAAITDQATFLAVIQAGGGDVHSLAGTEYAVLVIQSTDQTDVQRDVTRDLTVAVAQARGGQRGVVGARDFALMVIQVAEVG